jgi:hypothetical protein
MTAKVIIPHEMIVEQRQPFWNGRGKKQALRVVSLLSAEQDVSHWKGRSWESVDEDYFAGWADENEERN